MWMALSSPTPNYLLIFSFVFIILALSRTAQWSFSLVVHHLGNGQTISVSTSFSARVDCTYRRKTCSVLLLSNGVLRRCNRSNFPTWSTDHLSSRKLSIIYYHSLPRPKLILNNYSLSLVSYVWSITDKVSRFHVVHQERSLPTIYKRASQHRQAKDS